MNHRASLHLREIAVEARRVAEALEAGEFDEHGENAYSGELDHLLGHLALAWHCAHMTNEQIDRLSTEQSHSLSLAIPRFDPNQRHIELWEKPV